MQTQSFVFNNAVSVSFNEQGYLNAGSVAAKFGKAAKDYLKTQQTQEYITALAEFLSTGRKILVKENQLVTVINGGENRGTWLHPKLAVHFARWLDARFAVWCDMKIEEILGINQADKLTPAQKQQIQEAVRARHHRTGEHWQEIYRKLHSYLKVNSYHEITQKQFQVALNFLASMENAPTLFTQTSPMLSDHEISRFAVVTYYLDWATKQLKDLSEPLKELGANKEGVAAWTLWSESQSWIRHCQETLSRLQPSMTEQRFKEQVQNCLQRI